MKWCPDCCQNTAVEEEACGHEFAFGHGPGQVILTAVHPIFKCMHCDYQFADWRAGDAQEEAIRQHLKLKGV